MLSFKMMLPFLFAVPSWGSELNYSHTSSDTSISDKLKISYNVDNHNKVAISYRNAQDQSGAADDKSSSYKLNYRYKANSGNTFALDYKNADEYYFYESQALTLKANFVATSATKVYFLLDQSIKNYTRVSDESIAQTSLSAGFDYDFFANYTLGFEYSSYNYASDGQNSKAALANQAVALSDVSSFVSAFYGNSVTGYLEYNNDAFGLGLSYSLDTYLLNSNKVSTAELYGDLNFTRDLSFSLSYLYGVAEGSTTNTQTVILGLSYYY